MVIDADRVARDVVAPGEPALDEVIERFGDALRRPDGSLDRAALGRIVFADPNALRDLEAIVHPAVRQRILAALAEAAADGADAVVVEAIKLVEGGLAELCDEVWFVTCDPGVQRDRLVGRGSSPPDADQRIAAQAGIDDRGRPVATRVIDSSGDADATRALVDDAFAAVMMPR
jgi:dephospho-CoA kinase